TGKAPYATKAGCWAPRRNCTSRNADDPVSSSKNSVSLTNSPISAYRTITILDIPPLLRHVSKKRKRPNLLLTLLLVLNKQRPANRQSKYRHYHQHAYRCSKPL